MVKRYHLGPKGPSLCSAGKSDRSRGCPFGGASGIEDHFNTEIEAERAYEAKMAKALLGTVETSPRKKIKKVIKVGTSVMVALISTSGISNIAYADTIAIDAKGFSVEKLLEGTEESIDKLADKANDWLNRPSTKDSPVNKKVDNLIGKVPDFSDFLNFFKGGGSTGATFTDDGSITWQGKPLTPSAEEVAEAKALLDRLPVALENDGSGYDRAGAFPEDSKTKATIESRDIVDGVFNSRGRAVSGTLKDPYTGEVISFESSERPYDLEHLVALKEVHRSEDPNNPLTAEERKAIANDPNNLLLVTSRENRIKSDKDAKGYLPSYLPSQCRFAISTIQIKSDYRLRVDPEEAQALSNVLENKCEVE